jgi:hypothetical protein
MQVVVIDVDFLATQQHVVITEVQVCVHASRCNACRQDSRVWEAATSKKTDSGRQQDWASGRLTYTVLCAERRRCCDDTGRGDCARRGRCFVVGNARCACMSTQHV